MNKLMRVTNDEKLSLLKLVERNNSLVELRVLLEDEEFIKKQETDLEKNKQNMKIWWSVISKKYNLENPEQICYLLNFNDGFLYYN